MKKVDKNLVPASKSQQKKTLSILQSLVSTTKRRVTFSLKFGSFMKQRLPSVNKSLAHQHTLSSTFFFHSFCFGIMAAWREGNIYTADFIKTSGGFYFKIFNVKNDS